MVEKCFKTMHNIFTRVKWPINQYTPLGSEKECVRACVRACVRRRSGHLHVCKQHTVDIFDRSSFEWKCVIFVLSIRISMLAASIEPLEKLSSRLFGSTVAEFSSPILSAYYNLAETTLHIRIGANIYFLEVNV